MSDKTGIQWTDATWNPVRGCTKVSPGCAHCYAETFAERFRGVKGHPYEQGFDLRLVPEKLDAPLHWKTPRRVFVNSMSDLFQENVPDELIARVFAVMALSPQHTFQILTKRPGRMLAWFNWDEGDIDVEDLVGGALHDHHGITPSGDPACGEEFFYFDWPLPNVWLGVSVENQHFADERIPLLLQTPAAVRFISGEPLLGPVCLTDIKQQILHKMEGDNHIHIDALRCVVPPHIDWVICGGESGFGARAMQLEWARSLRDQCKAAGAAFFMKQLGGMRDKHGEMEDFPEDLRIREFPGAKA